ncbi:hypothetical protein BN135_1254 [Cronobacter muytjensii 530]
MNQDEKRAEQAGKKRAGERSGQRHQPRRLTYRAPLRPEREQQRQPRGETEQKVTDFRHHGRVSLYACGERE